MPEPLTIKVAEELAEKLRLGYSSSGRVTFWLDGDVMVCREDDRSWPHYWSTYCIHGNCQDCRLTCKTCQAHCLCPCHHTTQFDGEDGAK